MEAEPPEFRSQAEPGNERNEWGKTIMRIAGFRGSRLPNNTACAKGS